MTSGSKRVMCITEKEKKFLKKWEHTRLNKWRYIIYLGLLLGGFLATSGYLVEIQFRLAEFDVFHFLGRVLVALIVAVPFAYFQFLGQDKRYKEVKDNHLLDE